VHGLFEGRFFRVRGSCTYDPLGIHTSLEANSDPNQVFKVQGDLLIVALSVLMGAHFAAATKDKRGELNPAFIALVVALFVILSLTALAGRSYIWVKEWGEWLSIWIPFGIGALTLLVCIHFAQKAK
jgi:cell division protein FtsW (lipid II flippase)